MKNSSYRQSITTSASPETVYRALTLGFEKWWTTPDQPIKDIGDQAKFSFPPGKSFWTLKAIKLKPEKSVELECTEALHIHEGEPKEIEQEWLGTTVSWQISADEKGTHIHFEHQGLTPSLLCYGICEAGWDRFFLHSLKAYLETGVGRPHTV